jgi:hypothetical protein
MNATVNAAVPKGQPQPTITITHTNEQGTLVAGTQRGDGSREALRAAHFRWSQRLGMWFMPQSRGRGARRARIDQLAAGLRAAGFKVRVDIETYDPAVAFDALQTAARTGKRSDAATRQATRRENPVVMGRRAQRLEAEARRLTRILQTASGDYAENTQSRLNDVQADLTFLRAQIKRSGARQYTVADFKVGDLALVRGRWRKVKQVNPKTVAVETPYSWTDKYPYHEITDRRAADRSSECAGNGVSMHGQRRTIVVSASTVAFSPVLQEPCQLGAGTYELLDRIEHEGIMKLAIRSNPMGTVYYVPDTPLSRDTPARHEYGEQCREG